MALSSLKKLVISDGVTINKNNDNFKQLNIETLED